MHNHTIRPKALAKELGVSYRTVLNAIGDNRLSKSVQKLPSGHYQLDYKLALKEWVTHENNAKPEVELQDCDGNTIPPYATSRKLHKYYQAKQAELNYREKTGELVSRDEVEQQSIEMGQKVRDEILSIPNRLCAFAAAETDIHIIRQLMDDVLREALTKLSEAKF